MKEQQKEEFQNIMVMVNASAAHACPELPALSYDNFLILPDEGFKHTVEESTRNGLHPLFKTIIERRAGGSGQQVKYVPENSETWFNPDSNNYFVAAHSLEALERDKKLGYLGIGLNLCQAALWLSARSSLVESEEASRYAEQMISRLDEEGFIGRVIRPEDKEEMLRFIREKGSSLFIRGAINRIVVEKMYFCPQFGTVAEESVTIYLSRPIKERYVDLMSDALNLPVAERVKIKSRAGSFGTVIVPYDEVKGYEKAVLADLERLGFRGRRSVLDGYRSSEIGKRIVADYVSKLRR